MENLAEDVQGLKLFLVSRKLVRDSNNSGSSTILDIQFQVSLTDFKNP